MIQYTIARNRRALRLPLGEEVVHRTTGHTLRSTSIPMSVLPWQTCRFPCHNSRCWPFRMKRTNYSSTTFSRVLLVKDYIIIQRPPFTCYICFRRRNRHDLDVATMPQPSPPPLLSDRSPLRPVVSVYSSVLGSSVGKHGKVHILRHEPGCGGHRVDAGREPGLGRGRRASQTRGEHFGCSWPADLPARERPHPERAVIM